MHSATRRLVTPLIASLLPAVAACADDANVDTDTGGADAAGDAGADVIYCDEADTVDHADTNGTDAFDTDSSSVQPDCVERPNENELLCETLVRPDETNINDWSEARLNSEWTYHATAHVARRFRDEEPFDHQADLRDSDAFEAWRTPAIATLARILRLDTASWFELPLAIRELESVQLPGVRREKIDFVVEPGLRIPAYVFIPDERDGLLPGVLVIHGHSDDGKDGVAAIPPFDVDEDYHHNGALRLAQAGYVVLAPDVRTFGETGNWKQHEHYTHMLLLHGRVAVGQFLGDMQRALDVLEGRPEVDPDRLGVAGTSLGGQLTQLLAVYDDRVRAAAVAGFLMSYRETHLNRLHCVCQYIPMLGRAMDESDIAAMAAPTPVLYVMGEKDVFFPQSEARAAFERIEQAYALGGAEDSATLHVHGGGHEWVQAPIEQFFDDNL